MVVRKDAIKKYTISKTKLKQKATVYKKYATEFFKTPKDQQHSLTKSLFFTQYDFCYASKYFKVFK
jgi:hypothetical protein